MFTYKENQIKNWEWYSMQFWLKRFLSIPNRIGSGKETDLKRIAIRTGNGFRKRIAKGKTDRKRRNWLKKDMFLFLFYSFPAFCYRFHIRFSYPFSIPSSFCPISFRFFPILRDPNLFLSFWYPFEVFRSSYQALIEGKVVVWIYKYDYLWLRLPWSLS